MSFKENNLVKKVTNKGFLDIPIPKKLNLINDDLKSEIIHALPVNFSIDDKAGLKMVDILIEID